MTKALQRLIVILTLLLPLAFGVLAPAPGVAQVSPADVELPDYDAWRSVAERADEAIENARASTPALEELRSDLAEWRSRLQAVQGLNANAISTAQRQLDALGPPPEEGTEEPSEVTAQRAQLTDQINRLNEPVRAAELAFIRADELIRGVDRIIRARQGEEVLKHGPSPLNPVNWTTVFDEFSRTFQDVRGEIIVSLANPSDREQMRNNLPIVLIQLLFGLFLLGRGRLWSRRASARMLEGNPGPSRWLGGFALSTGSLLLPFLGVMFLVYALRVSALGGSTIDQMLDTVAIPVFFFLMARWVGTRVFPQEEERTLPLYLTAAQRKTGRIYAASLGGVAALSYFLREMALVNNWTEASLAVIMFPFIVISSTLLWRLSALLKAHVTADKEEDGHETYRSKVLRFLVLVLRILSVLAPIAAAVGYFRLSQYMIYPPLASLQLLSLLLILQRLVVQIYALVTDTGDAASDALLPILIGFTMSLASLPFFALFWGARPADLTELWTRLSDGYEVGGIVISPTNFVTFAIVFALGYTLTRLVQGTFRTTILPKTRLDTGGQNAVVSGLGYVGIALAAIIAVTAAGINLGNLAIVAGALSVGIGFGLQNIVSNFVAGIILLIERPISEGDWIEVGGVHGTVRQISVRSTVITTFDRSDVIVPNSDFISGQVTNYTRTNTLGRLIVKVGVAYGSDVDLVEKILREVAEGHPLVILNPPPAVLFRAFGASSLDFEVRVILRDVNFVLSAEHELNYEINRRFKEAGIEIPFTQTDLWLRNPETLAAARPNGEQTPPPRPAGGYTDEKPYRTDPPGHDADTDLDRQIERDPDGEAER
ncbi:MAG: DUF3772 domain-containing protein [Pseudomonadota bacterium]